MSGTVSSSREHAIDAEAHKDAKHIHDVLNKDGTKNAYETMLTEINSARQAHPTDLPAYKASLTKALADEKILPDLSIEWGRRAAHKVDVADGQLNAKTLSPYAEGSVKVDALTKSMASTLRNEVGNNSVGSVELGLAVNQRDDVRRGNAENATIANQAQTDGKYLTTPRTEYGGRSLLQLADQAGGTVDNKINGGDIQKLLDSKLLPISNDDASFLKNLADNWNSPRVARMRGQGDYITPESLEKSGKTAPETVAPQPGKANSAGEAHEAAVAGTTRDYLTRGNQEYGGKSLLELAAAAGDEPKTQVNKEDLQKLVDNKLANLSEDDSAYVKNLIRNWDTPQGRRLQNADGYLTKESLDNASKDQQKALAQEAGDLRTQQAAIVRELQTSKVGANTLFKAADLAGGNEDGLIDQGDLQKLLDNKLVKLSDQQSAFVKKILADRNKPAIDGLRHHEHYLDERRLGDANLT